MQLIVKESKSLNPTTTKSIRASASIRPAEPAEGLLVKPEPTPRASSQPYVGPSIAPVIGQKLSDLVNSIDPSFKLTPEAEEVLLSLADQFIDSVVEDSCKLAIHRVTHGGKAGVAPPPGGVNPLVDVTDINLVLKEKVRRGEIFIYTVVHITTAHLTTWPFHSKVGDLRPEPREEQR